MLPDYYKVLGIHRDADQETIRRAYRHQATKVHPDRGGSHEQMVQLNEAWYVLSNPGRRAEYDAALRANAPTTAMVVAEQNTRQARQEAEYYPKQWEEFESWMDSLVKDFHKARFLRNGIFPDVELNSFSGPLFLIGGAVAGFVIGASLMAQSDSGLTGIPRVVIFACVVAGAWSGVFIHQVVASASGGGQGPPGRHSNSNFHSAPASGSPPPPYVARQTPPPSPASVFSGPSRIVICPACDQRIRIPHPHRGGRVICRRCDCRFPA